MKKHQSYKTTYILQVCIYIDNYFTSGAPRWHIIIPLAMLIGNLLQ